MPQNRVLFNLHNVKNKPQKRRKELGHLKSSFIRGTSVKKIKGEE